MAKKLAQRRGQLHFAYEAGLCFGVEKLDAD